MMELWMNGTSMKPTGTLVELQVADNRVLEMSYKNLSLRTTWITLRKTKGNQMIVVQITTNKMTDITQWVASKASIRTSTTSFSSTSSKMCTLSEMTSPTKARTSYK